MYYMNYDLLTTKYVKYGEIKRLLDVLGPKYENWNAFSAMPYEIFLISDDRKNLRGLEIPFP